LGISMPMIVRFVMALITAAAVVQPVAAQDLKTATKKGSFDDVKFELSNAIIERGLRVDFSGSISQMLERTGADVGSTKPIYKHAEFMSFCSSKLSRQMMEADAANVAFCPYTVFIYETAAAPGEIVVGYRPFPQPANETSRAALGEIDKLLSGIIKAAVQ
jgi:uncharacterized protein (DUF302 family)